MARGLERRKEKSRGSGFKYVPRTHDNVRKQTEQNAGNYDSIFKNGIDTYRPQNGSNCVRFCPPTWEDNSDNHYAYEIWVHYGVGARGATYLCAKKMRNKPCPVCDIADASEYDGEKEEADKMRPKRACIAWVLDRDSKDSKTTPKIWRFGWTVDKDIGAIQDDTRKREVLQVADPDNGFDVSFLLQKGKEAINTKYSGFKLEREPTPLCEDPDDQDDVLDFIQETPLPDVLKFYPTAYLEALVSGTGGDDDDDDDDDKEDKVVARKTATRKKSRAEEEEEDERDTKSRGSRGSKRRELEDDDDEEEGTKGRDIDDDDEADDDDEDTSARSKSKKKRSRDDDDDDDDDRSTRRRGPRRDEDPEDADDDDDDADDEEDDEKDDRSSKRGKAKVKAKAKVDDDEDEDDDEDDRPVRGKSKSKSKSKDDDDDDDDDLPFDKDSDDDEEEEDDEEEDDRPARRTASKSKVRGGKEKEAPRRAAPREASGSKKKAAGRSRR